MDDECGFLVIMVHLDHRQCYRTAGDHHLFGRLDHAVEEFELLGLEGLQDPSANPFERCAVLQEPGAGAEIFRSRLAVGEAAGVFVNPHQKQGRLFGGRFDAAFAVEFRDDRAGGANRALEDLLRLDIVLVLLQVVVDHGDWTCVSLNQVVDLA
jgi:hypothetical protein